VEKHDNVAAPALLEGSQLTKKGRADVFRQREKTKRKKLIRAIVVVLLVDAYLYRRVVSDNPFQLPHLGSDWIIFLPAILLVFAVLLMVAMPLMNGRSPHVTIQPEQVEVGLTEVRGLDTQVEEIVRTLDMFLGYATFRDELGGTPRRGILFEGPPGTGKTYLAKAMSKQAGVPFMFIAAPALQSMWFGMTAYRIRSFFKALRKAARKEGGAIGFIEEIDAIGMSRDSMSAMTPDGTHATPAPGFLGRTLSPMMSSGNGGMVNELLIQMQSFDQAPMRDRIRAKLVGWVNGYLPNDRQMRTGKSRYNNILLIAATNRGDSLDPALLRPGRFDRRLFFDVPTKNERMELLDFFLVNKKHHEQLDDPVMRERLAHETFGYTPVMIEHLLDEGLLMALRDGRREMNYQDLIEAKFTEEIGTKQSTVYTESDRVSVATHEAGHATVAHFLGKDRRLEVLSIVKRRGSLGLLAHSDQEERFTRTKSDLEAGIAIALGGLVAEEMCIGESGTGPANDLAHATTLAANMVGAYGMAGSLISYDALSNGPFGGANLVAKVLTDSEGRQRVDDILEAQKERVRAVLAENSDVHAALRDELVREDILDVIDRAKAARN
jgi:cell division protease FtsH